MDDWFQRSQQVWESIHPHLEQVANSNKENANWHRGDNPHYQLSDTVWLATKDFGQPEAYKKLSPRYSSPFKTLKQTNEVTYKVNHSG